MAQEGCHCRQDNSVAKASSEGSAGQYLSQLRGTPPYLPQEASQKNPFLKGLESVLHLDIIGRDSRHKILIKHLET